MKVAYLGNLGNLAYNSAKFLRQLGVDAHVFVLSGEARSFSSNPLMEDSIPPDAVPPWIHLWSGKSSLLKDYPFFRNFDVIEAGTIIPLFLQFLVSKYVVHVYGSDIKEFASSSSLSGRLQRRAYRGARMIRFGDVTMLRWMDRFGLKKWQFVPCILDVKKYVRPELQRHQDTEEFSLSVFSPSRLDWTDTSGKRLSIKRNDLLIKAFAKFIKDGNRAELQMVDWGVDRRETRNLIKLLNIQDYVTILPQMKKEDLIRHYYESDVVVDQFFIASPGLVSFESMSCGKPVISYLDEEYAKVCYAGDIPPVVNAKTEDDIYQALYKLNDESIRKSIGSAAQEWMLKHHHGTVVAKKLLDIYQQLA